LHVVFPIQQVRFMSSADATLAIHAAVLPVGHYRRLADAPRMMDQTALLARATAIAWLVSVVYLEINTSISAYYFGVPNHPVSAMPEWSNWFALASLVLALLPVRLFGLIRRKPITTAAADDAVSLSHNDLAFLQRALHWQYALLTLLLVSMVASAVALSMHHEYGIAAFSNAFVLVLYAIAGARKLK
jgi:hypothetical protein